MSVVRPVAVLWLGLCLSSPCAAQDITQLGGDLTSSLSGRAAIQVTAPNVTSEENRTQQLEGFGTFHRFSSKDDGRGPRFNHDGCGSCHIDNGRGKVEFPPGRPGSAMVIKVSLPGVASNGGPVDIPGVGEQLQDHDNNGKLYFDISLRWRKIFGKYPDGSKYSIRRPYLDFKIPRRKKKRVRYSLRMAPIIIGPGLLEAIPEETLLSLSDEADVNGDGISGKPQYVPNIRTGGFSIGRFGFKASHPTTEQQSAAAAFNDIGLTNVFFPLAGVESELSDTDLRLLEVYQILAGVPAAREQENSDVIAGKELFQSVGCSDCHIMTLTTGSHEFSELENQVIHPFTDLLLHDMGRGLADKRAEFSARGSEWRTTALWGIGYSKSISSVKAHFLHDGRARTIEEAILWHAGEAAKSRRAFKHLSKDQRRQLLIFLDSL